MKFLQTFILICCCSIPDVANAWGLQGHRITAEIADYYLSRKAKKEIKKLLGEESIALASNWADFIRSDSSFDYLGSWHYINLPPNINRNAFDSTISDSSATNIFTKTNFLIAELKKPSLDRQRKIFYLKLLIHFIGDIHQPMHSAHAGDLGGNKSKVYWFGASSNLHRLWDEQLVEFQQLSYTEYMSAINHPTSAEKRDWRAVDIGEWIWESYLIAEEIYLDAKPNARLGYDYNYKYLSLVNTQLLKGGLRLAAVLNDIFG